MTPEKHVGILDTLELNAAGFTYLKQHVQRTHLAFQMLFSLDNEENILLNYQKIQNDLLSTVDLQKKYKVRIVFTAFEYFVSHEPLIDITDPVVLKLVPLKIQPLSQLKTTHRKHWDDLLKNKPAEAYDILGFNDQGFLVETSMFNLFYIYKNKFYTPPLNDGCLRGVLRQTYLDQGHIEFKGQKIALQERSLHRSELNLVELFVGNSVRGLLDASVL